MEGKFRAGKHGLGWISPPWRVNILLLAVIGVEVFLAVLAHRDTTDLESTIYGDDPKEGVYALYVVTNRDRPKELDRSNLQRLIDSTNPLVREWLFSTNFERILRPDVQLRILERLPDSASTDRARFYFEHGIRKSASLPLRALDSYLGSLDE